LKQAFNQFEAREGWRGFCTSSQVCFEIFAFKMVSASTSHAEDEQELIFSSSGDEISDFEGFDIDEMSLSFIARGNEQRESDSNQDMDDFLDESSDEDDSASESADEIVEDWSSILTPQTVIAFEERVGLVRNLPPDKKAIDFF